MRLRATTLRGQTPRADIGADIGADNGADSADSGVLRDLVQLLRCPWCEGGLTLLDAPGSRARVEFATLRCESCGRRTSITDGIWDAMGPHRASRSAAQLANVLAPTARFYEDLWRVRSLRLLSGRPFPIAEELAELGRAIRPGSGDLIVDVACSEGLYARELARQGATVIAVDHSRTFLRRVLLRAPDLPVVAVRALAQQLPLLDGVVCGAVMGGSLNEIGDAPAAIQEMTRVLEPNGRLFSMSLTVATTNRGRLLQQLARPSGLRFFTQGETERIFTDAGLVGLESRLDRVVLRISGSITS